MGFFGSIGKFLGGVAKTALPIVGGLVGGPLGGLAGGAISKALGGGAKPTMSTQGGPTSNLDQQFNQGITDEQARRKKLQGQVDQSYGDTNSAISRVEGMQPTLSGGYRSTSAGVDLSGVGSFDPSEQRGTNFDDLGNVDLEGVRGFKSKNLDGDTSGSDLENWASQSGGGRSSAASGVAGRDFDAGAAVESYARGATSDFMKQSQAALKGIRSDSVGAGRFGTGFVDTDQADAFTELGRGLTSDIARQSVAAADITARSQSSADQINLGAAQAQDNYWNQGQDRSLDARKTAAGLKFNRASQMDSNDLDAQKSAASLGIQKGTNMGDLNLRRAQGIDSSRQKAVTDAAGFSLDRAKTVDTLDLNNRQFGDTFNQNNAQFGVTSRQRRSEQLSNDENNSSNRYFDALVGGINKNQNAKNAAAERKSNTTGGLLNLAGTLGAAYLGRGK